MITNPIQYVLHQSEDRGDPGTTSSRNDDNSTNSRPSSIAQNDRNLNQDASIEPLVLGSNSGTSQSGQNSGAKSSPVEYVKCELETHEMHPISMRNFANIINDEDQTLTFSELQKRDGESSSKQSSTSIVIPHRARNSLNSRCEIPEAGMNESDETLESSTGKDSSAQKTKGDDYSDNTNSVSYMNIVYFHSKLWQI